MTGVVSTVVPNAQQAVAALQLSQAVQNTPPPELSPPQAPTAPFISPFISFDVNFDTAVLQIRDSSTGDVLRQIPTERTLELRQLVQARQSRGPTLIERQVQEVAETSTQVPQTNPVPEQQPVNNVTFEASVVAAQAASPEAPTSTAGATQVAIAALSAGAASGQTTAGAVNVTA